MTMPSLLARIACALAALVLGCSESPTGSAPTGTLEISAVTTGLDIDHTSYQVAVDGGEWRTIGINGSLPTMTLAAGPHTVVIQQVPSHCSLAGSAVRTVVVEAGASVDVGFSIDCAALVGNLEIYAVTMGVDLPSEDYVVSVVGNQYEAGVPLAADGLVTLSEIRRGNYELRLRGIPDNCFLHGLNPRVVWVDAGATVMTAFELTCSAPVAPLSGKIAFTSNRDGNFDIHVMNVDGSEARRLTSDPRSATSPAISPDGRKILFEAARGTGIDIYVMNADGTAQVNLTGNAATDEKPSWSPDGSRILFVSDRGGWPDVFVMNADGSDVVNLTSSESVDRPAAWSPDGTRIVFSSSRSGSFELYVMNADGTNVVQLTDTPASADFAPAWSPDGTRIAFISNPDPGNFGTGDIHVINADGTGRVNLTAKPEWNNRDPSWSRDGTKISFTSMRTGDSDVFVMDADGSNQVNISATPGAQDIAARPQAWSP